MTFNRIIYFFALLFSAALALFSGGFTAYAVLYTVALLPVLTISTAFLTRNAFKIRQSFDREIAYKGEIVNYTLVLENRSVFFFPRIKLRFVDIYQDAVEFDEIELSKREFELGPRSETARGLGLYCAYRGEYAFGIDGAIVYDALGLVKFRRKADEMLKLTVYPILRSMDEFPFSQLHMSELNSRQIFNEEDYAVISDIKKYEPSDSIKKIHWKLSARKNELLVKVFQANAINTAAFIIDTGETRGERLERLTLEDMICEDLVSAMNFCFERKYPVELMYLEAETGAFTVRRGTGGFNELYGAAARLKFNAGSDFCGAVDCFAAANTDGTNIIVFSHNLDGRLYEMLRHMKTMGHNVVLFSYGLSGSPELSALLTSLNETGVFSYFRAIPIL